MKKNILLIGSVFLLIAVMQSVAWAYDLEKSYDIYKATDITIDGKLDDWDRYKHTCLILPEEEDDVSYFAAYGGPDDLSAIFWFAWSDNGLYLAAEVTDDNHTIVEGDSSWMGDGFQFAGGVNNAYGPEINFSSENNPVKTMDGPFATQGVDNIQIMTTVEDTLTTYEIFFPWASLCGSKPDEIFPFCICMNENDGDGRVGWIETSVGIASMKNPDQFAVLKLLNQEAEENTGEPIRPEVKDITAVEETTVPQNIIYEIKTHITYPDIENHWARTAIDNMASRGIVRGIGELYMPSGTMTRAEFLAVLVRMAGLDLVEYMGGVSDVGADAWYAKYLAAALEGGLLPDGFLKDGAFCPGENIKREEMIALICHTYLVQKNLGVVETELTFGDRNLISDWAVPYIKTACRIGLAQGNTDNMICPQMPATRAEAAVMANNYIELLKAE